MQTMKKTVYPLVMATLAAFPVLFSCTEKEQEVSVDNHRFEYRFSLAEDATRALLNDEGVFWEAGDNVGLFTGAAQSLEAEVDAESSPKTIVVQTADPLAEGTTVYAYYPYVEGNTDATASKVVFPAEQSGGALSAMPLAGIPTAVHIDSESSTIGVIRFLNLGSIIDFRVYSSTYAGETVESVALQANTGNLAGTAAIDLTGVSWNETDETATIPALTWAEGAGSSTVTLTQSAPVAADKNAAIAGGHLYMVVAPGTYSGTITVTTNAARYTFPFTNKELVLNGLKRFNMNLDNATEREDRFVTINLEEATELVAGEKYVLVSNGFALVRDGGNASVAAFNANDLTVSVLDDLQENFEWTLGKNNDSNKRGNEYDFTNGGYFFGVLMNTSATPYTYSVALNTSKSVATNETIQNHNVNLENGYVYYRGNSSSQYLYYDTTAGAWNNHQESNGTFVAAYGTKLYQVKDMRADQNPQFSSATAEYDLYTNAWTVAVPTLSGAQGTVTYTSSDEAVAQVSSTGAITIMTTAKKGDTATITASAAGNDTYKPGEASYTITIVNSNPNVSRYNKVTSVDDLEAGAKYLIVYEGTTTTDNTPKVFNPVLSSDGTQFAKATSSAVTVDITSGVIESSDVADYQFTLEAGYYLKADKAAKYLYPGTSGSSSVLLAEAPASHALAITFNNGIAQISNGTGNNVRYVVWSTSNHYFSCNQQVSGQYSTGICLYKLDDGRQAQDIAFSGATAEYDLGTTTWLTAVPSLTGTAHGAVTYTSSDETVATVSSTGAVTPIKKGTTTITAKAAGDADYKPATASFELTVSNSKTPKYVKADEWENGEEYLIVSNGYVLRNNSGSVAAVAVDVVDGQVSFDAESTDLWKATADDTAFKLTNSSQYLRCTISSSWGSTSVSLSIGTASSTASNNQWTYDATNEYLKVAGSYYLYYSTSNSKWSLSNSQSDTHVAALYKLDDGQPKAQHLAFSDETVTFNIYGKETPVALTDAPTLSGAKTTVSWNSSNQNVAEVDGDGIVTVKAVGATTITATAAAEGRYLSGTASFVLTVTNEAPPTYTKVTSITSGGTYLIVSADAGNYNNADGTKAFVGDQNGTAATVNNAAGVITGDYSDYEFVISASGSDYTLHGPNGYVTGNSSNTYPRYIQVSTSEVTMSLSMASDFTGKDGQVADAFYFYYTKTSGDSTSKEVLYLNSDGKFKIGGTGRKYGVYLFKKN